MYSITADLKLVKHKQHIKTESSFNFTVVNDYRNLCYHMISFTQRNGQSPTRCVYSKPNNGQRPKKAL